MPCGVNLVFTVSKTNYPVKLCQESQNFRGVDSLELTGLYSFTRKTAPGIDDYAIKV